MGRRFPDVRCEVGGGTTAIRELKLAPPEINIKALTTMTTVSSVAVVRAKHNPWMVVEESLNFIKNSYFDCCRANNMITLRTI